MNQTAEDVTSSPLTGGLLLRVKRSDGRSEEMYAAPGLTIGRSQANNILLPEEAQVERSHARIIQTPEGGLTVISLGKNAFITTDEGQFRELSLSVGIRFKIGQTEFECIQGLVQPFAGKATPTTTNCPYCRADVFANAGVRTCECPACHQAVVVLPPPPSTRGPLVVPERFGEFRVERFVARGGMGLVLYGVRESDSEPVAIKLLLPDKSVSRTAADRFRQEIASLKRVRNPGVVKLLSYGREGHFNYFVMEWIEGKTLKELIAEATQKQESVFFQDAIRWFEQICKGLTAIHAMSVVHRDLKPSNILIGKDGTARISDLGIAKVPESGDLGLTATGEMAGTIEYMAPEQLSAPETVDQRADLYSLGVLMYETLTGARPTGAWQRASSINISVPTSFDIVLQKLLQRSADDRYQDITDLQVAIAVLRRELADKANKKSEEIPFEKKPSVKAVPNNSGSRPESWIDSLPDRCLSDIRQWHATRPQLTFLLTCLVATIPTGLMLRLTFTDWLMTVLCLAISGSLSAGILAWLSQNKT